MLIPPPLDKYPVVGLLGVTVAVLYMYTHVSMFGGMIFSEMAT